MEVSDEFDKEENSEQTGSRSTHTEGNITSFCTRKYLILNVTFLFSGRVLYDCSLSNAK